TSGSDPGRDGRAAARRVRVARVRGDEHLGGRGGPGHPPGHGGLAPAPRACRVQDAGPGLRRKRRGVPEEAMRDEPRPLRDESESALERALLGAGRGYPTSRDTRAKTLAALGLAGSATLAAGAAVAAGSSLGPASSFSAWLKLGWSKVVVGLSLAGAA